MQGKDTEQKMRMGLDSFLLNDYTFQLPLRTMEVTYALVWGGIPSSLGILAIPTCGWQKYSPYCGHLRLNQASLPPFLPSLPFLSSFLSSFLLSDSALFWFIISGLRQCWICEWILFSIGGMIIQFLSLYSSKLFSLLVLTKEPNNIKCLAYLIIVENFNTFSFIPVKTWTVWVCVYVFICT